MKHKTDPAAGAVVRELWKEHERIAALFNKDKAHENDAYWEARSTFQERLRNDVNVYLLASITATALLKVCAMMGKYRPMEPFAFVTLLSRAHDMIHEPENA